MADGMKWPNWGSRDPNEPPRDFFEKLLTDPKTILWIVLLIAGGWLASGFYIVNPGETGVVRRFGQEIGKASPGLNYRLPWPVDAVNIVNTEQIRRIEVGFRSNPGPYQRSQRAVSESLMLTGDENIVDAQMIVQYQVRDPSKFLFRLRSPEETLHIAAEVALRSIVGQTSIDEALTVGRTKIQMDTLAFLQRLMDDYQSGILVTEVKLQVVDPPDQVKDAFHEVVRAREDRERLTNQALGYQEDIIPKARGQAQKILREAEAYEAERVLKASGDAARFLELYEEYQNARQVTRDRLYLETIQKVLPQAKKLVVDSKVNSTVLPILPFGIQSSTPPKDEEDSEQTTSSQTLPQIVQQGRFL
ncbi:MAG: FtsH protease activity modulator HflK [Candidatus Omnitrophica bacterium]|nr:FtsH protease activity modulator HflK [Candidatus Omnitrophota bacterium]